MGVLLGTPTGVPDDQPHEPRLPAFKAQGLSPAITEFLRHACLRALQRVGCTAPTHQLPAADPTQGPCTGWERACRLGLKPQGLPWPQAIASSPGPWTRQAAGPPSPAPGEAESTAPTCDWALTRAWGHRGGPGDLPEHTPHSGHTQVLGLQEPHENSKAWWPRVRALPYSSDAATAFCLFSM